MLAVEAAEDARLAKLPSIVNQMAAVFVASDIKCSQQYQAALTLGGGLEARKKLSELVTFGCGFLADAGTHVSLISRQGTYALVHIENGAQAGNNGWVPATWVKGASPATRTPTNGKAK